MKNRFILLALAVLTLAGTASADIQSPPGHHYNWSRKLSRGFGNIVFGPAEYINRWRMTAKDEGPAAGFSDAVVEGTKRTVVRLFYGLYEVTTFPFPTWKLTYRPPYYRKEYVDNWWGYTQFNNEFGQLIHTDYSRVQGW